MYDEDVSFVQIVKAMTTITNTSTLTYLCPFVIRYYGYYASISFSGNLDLTDHNSCVMYSTIQETSSILIINMIVVIDN